MGKFNNNKLIDVGYKAAGGILSSDGESNNSGDAGFAWFSEKFGLSPNQLASDTWLQEVPYAASLGADAAITAAGITHVVKRQYVTLIRESASTGGDTQGHNETLWLARDASGNRMRNFINPFNHLNAAGATSPGYGIQLFQSQDNGSVDTGSEIYTDVGSWQFFYKEGALVCGIGDVPSDMTWNVSTQSNPRLHAILYQYVGLTAQPTSSPTTTGQVMSYNSTGNGSLEWTTPASGGSGSGTLYAELSNPSHIVQCDSSGSATDSFADSGTTLKIFRGTTQLDCGYAGVGSNDPASNDTWAIQSVTLDNVTHNAVNPAVDDTVVTYGNITGLSGNGGSIIWSIKVKDPTGTTDYTTIGIKQNFSKNIPGTDGDDGISPVALMMSNPAHSLPTTVGGSVTYTGSGTTINAYIGSTALSYGTTSGKWEVTASTTTGTITPGAITNNGTQASVAEHSGMNTNAASITYTVTVHHAVGGDQDYTLIQSLSKQITGATGTQGIPGGKGDDGDPGSDGTDGTDGNDGTHGTDGTHGVDGVDGTDGAAGAAGPEVLTVRQSNPTVLLPAASNGTVSNSYAGSGNIITVFRGETQLTWNAAGHANKWRMDSTTPTGITAGAETVSSPYNTLDVATASSMTGDNASIIFNVRVKDESPGTGWTFLSTKQVFGKTKSGTNGTNGTNGTDGTDGAAGAAGADGSDANVTKSNIESVLTGSGNYLAVGAGGTGLASVSTLQNSNTTKADVGLTAVDDTSDADKPVSTAQQTALNLKASLTGTETLTNKTISGATIDGTTTINGIAASTVESGAAAGATANQDSTATILGGNLTGQVDSVAVATIKSGAAAGATANQDSNATILGGNLTGTVNSVAVATLTGDVSASKTKTDLISVSSAVDLNDMPVPSSVQTSLDLKAPLASPAFTGTPTGIAASHVDLGNVTNESKATMFTSPAFTGTATAVGIRSDYFSGASASPKWELGTNVGNYLDIVSTSHIKMQLNDGYGNSSSEFSILDQAGANIWSIDLSGNIKTKGKIRDSSGNDKIDVNVSGQTDFTGSIKVKGSSDGYIYGPDADDLIISSNKDLVFTIDTDNNDNGKKFIFKDASTEIASLSDRGDLQLDGIITGKQREIYNQSFQDDIGTTKHYIPFKGTYEQTSVYQEEAAMVAPCDGKLISVTIRTATITGSGDLTIGLHKRAPGVTPFSGWSEVETETISVSSTDDNHVFHFVFSNARFSAADLFSVSIQSSSDLSGTNYWYVSTVMEWDWNNTLGTSSTEIES